MQNQSSGGNIKILFLFLTELPLTTTETELGSHHHRWSVRVVPRVWRTTKALISWEIREFRGSPENACNCARKLYKNHL